MTHIFIWMIVVGSGMMSTILQNAIIHQSELGNITTAQALIGPMWLLTAVTLIMGVLGLVIGYRALSRTIGF